MSIHPHPPRATSAVAARRPPRVLLVESLDAAGSDRLDARERAGALRAAGAAVRAVTLEREGGGAPSERRTPTPAGPTGLSMGPAGLAALRDLARDGRFDLVLVAAASPGGGPAAQVLAPIAPARWWPTGLPAPPGWGARLGLRRDASLPGLPPADGEPAGTPAGIAWSSIGSLPSGRSRLALWDGDYLLAPLPLAGGDGSRVLEAFADLAEEWSGLDLVVLAQPQPVFEREARARGVGARVHFVGPAPREAEWAWWAHAAGAVLAGRGAVAGGLLLRALAAGCPPVVVSSDASGVAIARWIAAQVDEEAALAVGGRLSEALARLLGRERGVEVARAHGRRLSERHMWEHLAPRLAAALPVLVADPRARRAAAA